MDRTLPSPHPQAPPPEGAKSGFHSLTYRPEIDGIRAIAVLAVVLFHAGFGIPGGFVGVDIFFVLSGYLITSLILKELNNGSFSMVDFWERRVRRIAPALAAVIVASAVGAWGILLSRDLERFGGTLLAQSTFISNIYFWLYEGNYFSGLSKEKPLLHTWSLAVEEQFYLFIPIILYATFRYLGWRQRKIFGLLALLCVGSLVSAALALSVKELVRYRAVSGAYYLLPFRAWEMLLGSLLAGMPSHWFPQRKAVREVVSALGLGAMIWPCFAYTSKTVFPGVAALPPCLGAALVIWANTAGKTQSSARLTVCGRFLASRPLVAVGLISYSLYLWHWPLLAYAAYLMESSVWVRGGLVLLAGALATASWKWVETPFRRRTVCATRSSLFWWFGAFSVLCLLFGSLCIWNNGFPGRFKGLHAVNDQLAYRYHLIMHQAEARPGGLGGGYRQTLKDLQKDTLPTIGSQAKEREITFLLWGDSHALALEEIVARILRKADAKGGVVITAGIPVLRGFPPTNRPISEEIASALIAYLHRHPQIRNVLWVGYWSNYQSMDKEAFQKAFGETLEALRGRGVNVWVLKGIPPGHGDIPRLLTRRAPEALYEKGVSWTFDKYLEDNSVVEAFAAKSPEGTFIEVAAPFRLKDRPFFRVESEGVSLFIDSNHISSECASSMIEPLIEKALLPALRHAN